MKQEVTQNKMAEMPVPKLLLNMGIPIVLSMMLQAVYNIVDSFFVSNMPDMDGIVNAGEAAVNALTLAFPVQMLIVALGIGTGVGINVLLSKSLGQGNKEKAGRTVGNAYVLGAIIYIVFLLFGIFGADAFIASQTKDAQIRMLGEQYLGICCTISFGIVFFSLFEKMLQATGRTKYSTIAQVAGALTNIVLDPIMIYGKLGCPALGVRGAAYATVIGQIVSLAVAAFFHFKYNREMPRGLKYSKPDGRIIGEIYAIGVPAIIAQAVMSVMNYGINLIFGKISVSYVTAYGIFYKIQQFVLFMAFGLRDAITPIISFNYGKRDRTRVREGMKYGMIYTLLIMLVCFAALEIFARPFAGVFSLSEETTILCVTAMHVVSFSFLFAGANIAFQGIFQALDCGIQSLVLSLLRQLILVLPLAWLFAEYAPGMVWISFIIAEAFTTVVGCFFLKQIISKKINGGAS